VRIKFLVLEAGEIVEPARMKIALRRRRYKQLYDKQYIRRNQFIIRAKTSLLSTQTANASPASDAMPTNCKRTFAEPSHSKGLNMDPKISKTTPVGIGLPLFHLAGDADQLFLAVVISSKLPAGILVGDRSLVALLM